jgi:hypothetical protein
VIVFKRHNALNQQWDIVYVDTLQPVLKDGDWWPAFGMYIGKEFSIVTKLNSGRYLDLVGDKLVIKTRTASDTQKWYFDYKSRTIMSKSNNKSINISNSGRGKLNVYSTTSDWF